MINLLLHPFLGQLVLVLIKIVCLLVAIAYYTLAERKIMASIQRRRGPNVVGAWGLLQPLADGLKLIAKEIVIPSHSNARIFVIAPLVILTLGLLTWSIIPFGCFDYFEFRGFNERVITQGWFTWELSPVTVDPKTAGYSTKFITNATLAVALIAMIGIQWVKVPDSWFVDFGVVRNKIADLENELLLDDEKALYVTKVIGWPLYTPRGGQSVNFIAELNDISDVHYSLLLVLALSSLTVYGLIIAGWASNSKYAFLGALRSAAQMISYEVAISLVIIPVVMISGSLNFVEIVSMQEQTIWFVVPLLPISVIFFISMIAETNRTPFDLPEAEAELVAGYNVEYSSIIFAMFFLAEYSNMIMMSLLKCLLFIAGWTGVSGLPPAAIFSLKGLVFCFLFVLVRATFPRYRYDQLIDIGWKIFLPVTTGFLVYLVGYLFTVDGLPALQEVSLANYSELLF